MRSVRGAIARAEWNILRKAGAAKAASSSRGSGSCCAATGSTSPWANARTTALEKASRRTFRAWQLKEELRDIFSLSLNLARAALDAWLAWASRSQLAPFVKLARSIRSYRKSIEATIEWKLTNGIAESNNAERVVARLDDVLGRACVPDLASLTDRQVLAVLARGDHGVAIPARPRDPDGPARRSRRAAADRHLGGAARARTRPCHGHR